MKSCETENGSVLDLADQLGQGGEARIFAIRENSAHAVKIYHKPLDPEKIQKLKFMISLGRKKHFETCAFLAWPQEIVLNHHQQVIGFLMPRFQDVQEIHQYISPKSRKKLVPNQNWAFLCFIAKNLAASFHHLHSSGIVIGDVNQKMALVNPSAQVHLVDCDSYQLNLGEHTFRCTVGVEEFTAPEIQGEIFAEFERSIQHDLFGLAVLVFQILMMGRHPYSVQVLDGKNYSMGEHIKSHRYAYAPNLGSAFTPYNTPITPKITGKRIQELFQNAFGADPSLRPSAQDWYHALDQLCTRLGPCLVHPEHRFAKDLSSCPWCLSKTVFFLPLQDQPQTSFLQKFEMIHELEHMDLSIYEYKSQPFLGLIEAEDLPTTVQRSKTLRNMRWALSLNLVILCLALSLTQINLIPLMILILLLSIWPTGAYNDEKLKRKCELQLAEIELDSFCQKMCHCTFKTQIQQESKVFLQKCLSIQSVHTLRSLALEYQALRKRQKQVLHEIHELNLKYTDLHKNYLQTKANLAIL